MERFEARQGEHDTALGVEHSYEVTDGAEPGTPLNVAEESAIRTGGGSSRKGGPLANKRYQMCEKKYRAAGGTVPKPTK